MRIADDAAGRQEDKGKAGDNSASQNKKAPITMPLLATRQAKTKEQRNESKGGKAGHPGRFHGRVLEFLQSNLPEYAALPAKGEAGRTVALAKFWESVIDRKFWAEFTADDARATMASSAGMSDTEVISSMNDVRTTTVFCALRNLPVYRR